MSQRRQQYVFRPNRQNPLQRQAWQIRCGGQLVPFTNAFPQNTDLYRLMSTRPGEMLN